MQNVCWKPQKKKNVMKHDNHVTSFATILSCVNIAHVFIFTTYFGYDEPSSGETKYNTPNIQVTTKIVTQITIKLEHTYENP
jgi:hypothetical protein